MVERNEQLNSRKHKVITDKAVCIVSLACVLLLLSVLVLLQVLYGSKPFFSMYVKEKYFRIGYFLYFCLFCQSAIYIYSLINRKRIFLTILQISASIVFIAIVVKPYYSLEHISFVPFLFALQSLIYILDFVVKDLINTSKLKKALWTMAIFLMVLPPLLGLALFSPIFEKSFICLLAIIGFFLIWTNIHDKHGLSLNNGSEPP